MDVDTLRLYDKCMQREFARERAFWALLSASVEKREEQKRVIILNGLFF